MNQLGFIILFFFTFISGLQTQEACNFHLVILGSSTAAGSGPSSSDSTWVNRYKKHLQEINPSYKVTNLAVGGTTTYHIMPDDFVPPQDRANPNPEKNISEALRLNATAILINMPSNDTSQGVLPSDQLNNFNAMWQFAQDADIPIWICTTQPKNYSNEDLINNQIIVRDEILTSYGDFAINFWEEIADIDGRIKGQYDSGDGTHLNDAAHAILANRVIQKSLPAMSLVPLDEIEYQLNQIEITEFQLCGGTYILSGTVSNLGIEEYEMLSIDHYANDALIGSSTIQNLSSCEQRDFDFQFDRTEIGNAAIRSELNIPADLDPNNNNLTISINIEDVPSLSVDNDTICENQFSVLNADSSSDQIFWYDSEMSTTPIASGPQFTTNQLTNDTSYFVEAVIGNTFFKDDLFTSDSGTREWNGVMFNIVPKVDITIDSLAVKLKDLGLQTLKGVYKSGTYIGAENDQTQWTNWGTHQIDVTEEEQFYNANFGPLELTANDTFGIYLHLVESNRRLMYANLPEAKTYENNELSLITGTGITHTFRENYFPRDWNGSIFYHHGFKPEGSCQSPREEVFVTISRPNVDLGPDTTIFFDQTLLIEAQPGFLQYVWNGVPRGTAIKFEPTEDDIGTNIFTVRVRNEYGCFDNDTILVEVTYPDRDEDGFTWDMDCNDMNPEIYPGAPVIFDNNIDEDCDGTLEYSDMDNDGFDNQEDCNDMDPDIFPGATEIPNNGIDEDCDGQDFIIDNDNDGYNSDEDCDDNNPDINPGADEIPNNGIDEDCDGIAEIQDADNDGFNSDEDCNDFNAGIYPGATEIPNNGIDEDCDGQDLTFSDNDNDGFTDLVDCDDNNPDINPDATEIPNNDIDEDCDGIALMIDEDNDGFNSDDDCDDANSEINPGAMEIPNNNIDEDCDGIALIIDNDNDGFNSDEDCDDNNADINPSATEIPNNSVDEDCDGTALVIDNDNDGFNSDEDCDDNNADINPNATEIINNSIDEDCDGIALIIDDDNDGFNSDEDCDDNNPDINPGATEIPNNTVDEDCDGIALIIDDDNDGFNSDEDCDDNNPSIYPGAPEIANNGIDEDCNGSDWILSSNKELENLGILIAPNPSTNGIFNIKNYNLIDEIEVFEVDGTKVYFEQTSKGLKINQPGKFILKLRIEEKIFNTIIINING